MESSRVTPNGETISPGENTLASVICSMGLVVSMNPRGEVIFGSIVKYFTTPQFPSSRVIIFS